MREPLAIIDLDRPALRSARDFTVSAMTGTTGDAIGDGFGSWWAERNLAGHFQVDRIPFPQLNRWDFQRPGGNLVHESGRFFAVEGVRVRDGDGGPWSRPIMNQPEIGVLGILVKKFSGVLHCLMQAKMEPGNVNVLQLSPTVQATRSNYTRIHRGSGIRYLEHFRGAGRGRVLVDVLQSEQGAWFWHKFNRNMVVEVAGDVPEHEDFRWFTLGQVRTLLATDNLINMDARTVLSCIPFAGPAWHGAMPRDAFTEALHLSYEDADPDVHTESTMAQILTWFIEAKTRCEWTSRLIPLHEVTGWKCGPDEIVDDGGADVRVIAVAVEAGNREVTRWTQPLFAPRGHGLAAFVARPIGGVAHMLVQVRPEPGLAGVLEMAPTVQVVNADVVDPGVTVPFLSEVLAADPARVRFDTVLSEEGGRFYHSQTRYRIVEVGDEFPVEVPENFAWLTMRQLMDLLRHSHYLNIEARSLLACVHSMW